MNKVPVHRPSVGARPVSTVVPTTLEAPFAASRRPRGDAHTTFPHNAFPHGAIAMIALPIGFFHNPSTADGLCGVPLIAESEMMAAETRISDPSRIAGEHRVAAR